MDRVSDADETFEQNVREIEGAEDRDTTTLDDVDDDEVVADDDADGETS